jgi:hypothetical protein
MPEKLLYGNVRGAILALFTSRKDIGDDADGAAVEVAEEMRLNERTIALLYDRFTTMNISRSPRLETSRAENPLMSKS